MQKLIMNVLYSAVALIAFGFAAYAPTFGEKATAGVAPQLYSTGDEVHGFVVGILDGDTLKLMTDDQHELRIRLSEVDAPELGQSYGDKAKQSLGDLAFNKPVAVQVRSTDRYGLISGRVYVGTLDLNLAQVGRGLAWADPKSAQDERVSTLEARSRAGHVGLWADKEPVAPWDYRKRQG